MGAEVTNMELRDIALPLPAITDMTPPIDPLELVLRHLFDNEPALVELSTESDLIPTPWYEEFVTAYAELWDRLYGIKWPTTETPNEILSEYEGETYAEHSKLRLVQYNGVPVALCHFGQCSATSVPSFIVCRKADLLAILPD